MLHRRRSGVVQWCCGVEHDVLHHPHPPKGGGWGVLRHSTSPRGWCSFQCSTQTRPQPVVRQGAFMADCGWLSGNTAEAKRYLEAALGTLDDWEPWYAP